VPPGGGAGVAQPLVSHHLRVLRQAGLVQTSRYRFWTYYRLRPDAVARLAKCLSTMAEMAAPAGRARRPCC
jgi:ArsR family transcriptional regulator, arsenate/arsenite/antimonite-responsive transcriptional repressor